MKENKLNYKVLNVTILMLLLYLIFSNLSLWIGVIGKIISVLSPFIIAFVFAYAFAPIINYLKRKGLKEWAAVTIVVVTLVFVILLLLYFLVPMLYTQSISFAKSAKELIHSFGNTFNLNVSGYETKITAYFNNLIKNLGNAASSTALDFVNSSLSFAGKFIVGFVGFIYFLADMDDIRGAFRDFLLSVNKRSYDYFKCLDTELGNYIKGLVIFMIIQFIEYSTLYLIIGHPNWLILGVLACLTAIIPYFGGLTTNLIALLTASLVSKPVFIGTLIICLIFPQLDGYFTSPKVYGKTNKINPLITVMAVSIGGTVAGIWGIAIALPVYLLARTTYRFFKKDLKKGVVLVKKSI
jgi:predicted PurR-regulated permease PerM